jgi:hypothetical protein
MTVRNKINLNKTTNSVTLVRKRTIPTERPPLLGEVSANFSGERVSRGRNNESPQPWGLPTWVTFSP